MHYTLTVTNIGAPGDADEIHIRYTTAPPSYDGFGTTSETLALRFHSDTRDQTPYRKVVIQDSALEWQISRYGSAMYPILDQATFDEWQTGERPLIVPIVL